VSFRPNAVTLINAENKEGGKNRKKRIFHASCLPYSPANNPYLEDAMAVKPEIWVERTGPNLFSREATDVHGEPAYADADLYNFDLNKAVLKWGHEDWLRDVACDWIRRSHLNCFIMGETSRSGPHDYNVRLSFKRAFAAFHVLLAAGIDGMRIKVYGVGEALAHQREDATDRKVQVALLDLPIDSTSGLAKMKLNWIDPFYKERRRLRRQVG
jgi:outer membrane protein OmpA-like peptidoglycan-associated protein